jgi:hypothetical protein
MTYRLANREPVNPLVTAQARELLPLARKFAMRFDPVRRSYQPSLSPADCFETALVLVPDDTVQSLVDAMVRLLESENDMLTIRAILEWVKIDSESQESNSK